MTRLAIRSRLKPTHGAQRAYRQHQQARRARQTCNAIHALRRQARDEIDRLLAFLDETDGFTMTELEPSLGGAGHFARFNLGDDLEGVSEDGDGNPDDEPTLGWTENHRWGTTARGLDDCEVCHV